MTSQLVRELSDGEELVFEQPDHTDLADPREQVLARRNVHDEDDENKVPPERGQP